MLFPVGDTPNPKGFTPYVNWALILINALVYVFISWPMESTPVDLNDPNLIHYLQTLYPSQSIYTLSEIVFQLRQYDLFVFTWGYKAAAPELGDLFASLFLHGGWLHLASNVLFLWIFGDNVEYHLGRVVYLLVYLLSGVLATLSYSVLAMDSMLPMIGASGAISGVLGMYFLLFPRNKVKIFVFLFVYIDIWLLPVRWVLAFYVVVDNLLPLLLGSESNVAYGAHLGGFFAGLGVAWARERLWRWPQSKEERPQEDASSIMQVQWAVGQEDKQLALQHIFSLDKQQLSKLSPDECVRLASWLQQEGKMLAAAQLLRLCLKVHASSPHLARVYLAFGLLRLAQGQTTAAYQHLQSVFDYRPDPQTAQQAKKVLAQISEFG